MKNIIVLGIAMFIAISSFAQQDSTKSLKGRFVLFGLSGNNEFRVVTNFDTAGTPSYSNYRNHFVSTEIGYGWFYKENKSIDIAFRTKISFNESSNQFKDWDNSYGIVLKKAGFKHLYNNKLYLFLSQSFLAEYGYSRIYRNFNNLPIKNPTSETYALQFGLIPGLMFKPNNQLLLSVSLQALTVNINRSKFNNGLSKPTTQFNYNIFSNLLPSGLQFKAIWLPKFINRNR